MLIAYTRKQNNVDRRNVKPLTDITNINKKKQRQ